MSNKNKNKGKQKKPSWFDTMRQQYQTDQFLYRVNTAVIRKDAMKIFKDIASNNINIEKDSVYFSNYTFTYNLSLAASDNAYYTWACYTGLLNTLNAGNTDDNLIRIARELNNTLQAYNTIGAVLNNILTDIQQTNGAYVGVLLQQAMVALNPFKYCFNGFFITIGREGDKSMQYAGTERRIISNGQGSGNQNSGYVFQQEDSDQGYFR